MGFNGLYYRRILRKCVRNQEFECKRSNLEKVGRDIILSAAVL
jgi:hypothetical protein